MPRDGAPTRAAIMDAAEALILETGFAATSVDKVIERAGVTKGTFFYHFKTKADLAQELIERFAAADLAHLESDLARAEQLSRDPLQQVLIFVGLLREEMALLVEPYPGCLFASCVYEAGLFERHTLDVVRIAHERWRERLGAKLEAVIDRYPPRLPVTATGLVDMIAVIFEGAFLMSKVTSEPGMVAAQLDHYRQYLELVFAPDGG